MLAVLLSKFIAEKDADQWHRFFVNVRRHVKKNSCILTLKRGYDSMFPAMLEGIRIPVSDGTITVRIAISDLTDIKRAEEAEKERIKELNCLYGISTMLELPGISLNEILKRTVLLIPPAWQFPEITEACIVLEGQAFQTPRFRETSWMLAREIFGRVKRLAKISLFESMSAWNVISTYRDQKFGRFTNPGQQFELVSSHAEGWVKGGDRHCPLLASKIFSP